MGEAMHAAEAFRIRPALLRVADGVDAVADAVEHRVIPLSEHHLLRVAKEMAHGDAEIAGDLGDVALDGGRPLRAGNGLADDLARPESSGFAHDDSILLISTRSWGSGGCRLPAVRISPRCSRGSAGARPERAGSG